MELFSLADFFLPTTRLSTGKKGIALGIATFFRRPARTYKLDMCARVLVQSIRPTYTVGGTFSIFASSIEVLREWPRCIRPSDKIATQEIFARVSFFFILVTSVRYDWRGEVKRWSLKLERLIFFSLSVSEIRTGDLPRSSEKLKFIQREESTDVIKD